MEAEKEMYHTFSITINEKQGGEKEKERKTLARNNSNLMQMQLRCGEDKEII